MLMTFPCPCRRLAAAVALAVISLSMIGCNSHERVETALAKSSFVSVSSAWTAPSTPAYTLAPAPHSLDALPPAIAGVDTTRRPTTPAKMATASSTGDDLRVMSFNLRVPFLLDGMNHWGFRKNNVIKTIEKARPDVIGLQECVADQADFLREELTAYDFRGVGRGDGRRQSEFAPVMWRRDKFKEIDHGYFWLSTTPNVPGSKSWGAWSTRMCTWVKLQPLDGGAPFAIFNAHLDNMSGRARENSARLMRQRINTLASGMGVIVTGDFNADAGSAPYKLLLAGEQVGIPQLLFDAFRLANPKVRGDEGTRHDFNGARGGNRIDWILCTTNFTPVRCDINRTRSLLGYPSDHYPVQAVLRPAPAAARQGTMVANMNVVE
jgi:endonuclease/exonuclease/phosphatase family metal-dependent hydrolase